MFSQNRIEMSLVMFASPTLVRHFKYFYPLLSQTFRMTRDCRGATTEKFLKGKVALATGSTSGIGLDMVHGLALRGADVLLSGFGDEALIETIKCDISKKYGVKCEHFPADLTQQAEVDLFINEVMSAFPGGIDVLVNNAGFQHVSKVQDFPVGKWNDLIAVMLTTPFLLIRSFLPPMLEKRWGRIINVASVHSLKASPFKSAYCSAKHGLAGLTKVVALETAGSGVTCNAISPGFVETPILISQVRALADKEKISYEEAKKQFMSFYHPSKEAVSVKQLSEMCVFLCTEAADQVTGSNFVMDGGWNSK